MSRWPRLRPGPPLRRGRNLGDLSWPEAEARPPGGALVVLPFAPRGKEHGPHCPECGRQGRPSTCARSGGGAPGGLAPPIAHGWLPAFRAFPGTEVDDPTVSSGTSTRSRAPWSGPVRVASCSEPSISKAGGLPLDRGPRPACRHRGAHPGRLLDVSRTMPYRALQNQERGGHADEIETSIHLFLQPRSCGGPRGGRLWPRRGAADYPGYEPGLFSRDRSDQPTRKPESTATEAGHG